jgi:hypothetical protein
VRLFWSDPGDTNYRLANAPQPRRSGGGVDRFALRRIGDVRAAIWPRSAPGAWPSLGGGPYAAENEARPPPSCSGILWSYGGLTSLQKSRTLEATAR